MGEQLAGAPHAGLHFVQHQQQAVLVAQGAQASQKDRARHANAALALNRLNQYARRFRPDGGFNCGQIAEGHLIEPVHLGAEAVYIFGVAARRDGGQRASVERAFKRNEAKALGMAAGGVVFTRSLDRAFQSLGAGIGEEDIIGEGRARQPLSQRLSLGNAEQVRDMPQFAALLGQSRNQRRVRMAQSANGDAGAKIEIARPVFGHQPCALASHERNVSASVSGKERRLRQVGRL